MSNEGPLKIGCEDQQCSKPLLIDDYRGSWYILPYMHIYIHSIYTNTDIYIYTVLKKIHTLGTVIIHCGHLYWSTRIEWNDMSCFDAQMLMEPRLRELFQALDVGGEGSLSVKEAVLGPGKCPERLPQVAEKKQIKLDLRRLEHMRTKVSCLTWGISTIIMIMRTIYHYH